MRRLTYCLLAAACLVASPTTHAVEFKIDDAGSTTIRSKASATAPAPTRSPVYSPRVAQLPEPSGVVSETVGDIVTQGGGNTVSVGDVFESPIDGGTGAANSLVEDLGNGGLQNQFVPAHEQSLPYVENEIVEGSHIVEGEHIVEGAIETGCSSTGGPSCSQSEIDTSHVHWKGGDLFTADDCGGCTSGCSDCGSGGGGLLGGIIRRPCHSGCSGGGGCTGSCCGSSWFVDGWISQGYTFNKEDPPSGFNTPLTFNDRDEEWMVNQVYLQFGKRVKECGCGWDWGGQIDLLYGTDYFFTQSIGLETRRDGSPHWNSSDGPRSTGASIYGLAMPQAYLEFYSPWLKGINVKLGHFYTTVGYESVMAPENFFYSHAYTMQYGEPFTHTGILTSFNLGRNLTGHFGVTRGWDTWEDPNGTPGYLAGVSWTPTDVASLAFTMHTGREDAAGDNNRFVYSLVYTRELTNNLRYVLQHDLGNEANGEFDTNFQTDSATWYGVNQYVFLDLTRNVTAGLRAEWFRDQDNARVLAIPQETFVDGSHYAQVSLGLNVRKGNHFVFRPEVRWDWSDVVASGLAGNGVFNDFTEDNQLTIAADMILKF